MTKAEKLFNKLANKMSMTEKAINWGKNVLGTEARALGAEREALMNSKILKSKSKSKYTMAKKQEITNQLKVNKTNLTKATAATEKARGQALIGAGTMGAGAVVKKMMD